MSRCREGVIEEEKVSMAGLKLKAIFFYSLYFLIFVQHINIEIEMKKLMELIETRVVERE